MVSIWYYHVNANFLFGVGKPILTMKSRNMNQTHQADTASAIAMISANMLQQIISLQEVINSRQPHERFPTTQEAGLITKMIAGLEKLKRYLAPPKQSESARKKGGRSKVEGQPTDELYGVYQMPLSDEDEHIGQVPETEESTATAPPQAVMPPADPNMVPFPILEHEFAEYEHLFADTRKDASHTTIVKGIAYSTNWLQYNLYQYCLPPQERRFFYNEARYHHQIAHENIIWLIQKYLSGRR